MIYIIEPIWEKIHSSQAWAGYLAEHNIRFIARNYYCRNRKDVRSMDFGFEQGAHTWNLWLSSKLSA